MVIGSFFLLLAALIPPQLGNVKVGGHVGALQDRFLVHRILSDFARDQIWKEARDAFTHPDDDVFMAPIGMWKGEFWGKLMISACRVAEYLGDGELKAFLHDEGLRLIAFQHADGYLGTYVNPEFVVPTGEPPMRGGIASWNWNLWCRKYTLWGLLACYRLTGDTALLEAADRAMAHQITMLRRLGLKLCETGTTHMRGLPPCSILKPLLWLYHDTGNADYLVYAKEINGYWRDPTTRFPQFEALLSTGKPMQDWYPDETGEWGKAYEMMSFLAGMLEFYRATGDGRTLDTVKRMWARISKDESNLCGSVGYNDQFTGASRHLNGVTEPCDAIHWMRLCHELWLITAETKYIDAFERTFYNAFLAGVRPDGKWGAREVRSHGRHRPAPPQSGMKLQHCCVNNMPRGFMDAVQTVAARGAGNDLYIALYHDFMATLGEDRISVSGGYPVQGSVAIRLVRAKAGKVFFRRPGWCGELAVFHEGRRLHPPERAGWMEVAAPAGESLWNLDFHMKARIVHSDRQPVADYVGRDATGKADYRLRRWYSPSSEGDLVPLIRKIPAATVERGPLLLAKSAKTGAGRETLLDSRTVNDGRWTVFGTSVGATNVWGWWRLRFDNGAASRFAEVCDFASAAEWTTNRVEFSIFF